MRCPATVQERAEPEQAAVTACGHVYHLHCWQTAASYRLANRQTALACPNCRSELTKRHTMPLSPPPLLPTPRAPGPAAVKRGAGKRSARTAAEQSLHASLVALGRRDLQSRAKAVGVRANLTSQEIITEILSLSLVGD